MQIQVMAQAVVSSAPEETFSFVTDMDRFPDFFPGNLLIPSVTRVEVQGELPQKVGTLRTVTTADGTQVTERVDVFDPPREHTYTLSGFRPPNSFLFRGAQGRWLLSAEGSGTRIEWHYSYELSTPLVYPLVWLVIGIFWRRAMQDCLQRMQTALSLSTA